MNTQTATAPKFAKTYCSQCGREFGPGDHGYSHCDNHPPLSERSCKLCKNWTRLVPDDLTAPEGKCGLARDPGFYPLGYWPHTLQRDVCRKFGRAALTSTSGTER